MYNGNNSNNYIAVIENATFESKGVDHYTAKDVVYVQGWNGTGYKSEQAAIKAANNIVSKNIC